MAPPVSCCGTFCHAFALHFTRCRVGPTLGTVHCLDPRPILILSCAPRRCLCRGFYLFAQFKARTRVTRFAHTSAAFSLKPQTLERRLFVRIGDFTLAPSKPSSSDCAAGGELSLPLRSHLSSPRHGLPDARTLRHGGALVRCSGVEPRRSAAYHVAVIDVVAADEFGPHHCVCCVAFV